ncbi:hypothetical protein [Dethiothermospora halolimnae]|uniref:hypothetical protein n=1 Tax=Dethiothermospora halolimnae TaxID=3114390 RepID=UPI003CCBC5D5
MRSRFMSGIVTGSLIGITAGMYAASRMSPRQRRKVMKTSRRMLDNVVDGIGLF